MNKGRLPCTAVEPSRKQWSLLPRGTIRILFATICAYSIFQEQLTWTKSWRFKHVTEPGLRQVEGLEFLGC